MLDSAGVPACYVYIAVIHVRRVRAQTDAGAKIALYQAVPV